ncbi:hypothetical protein [Rhodococcus sp. T2V]|uniref:hypothetical protein n=1 Tax=Rhodococcus sp. T2V TaxID=3034164 RepID=UPI0023E0FA08|nr:hypothetical protein [Rhodococcus sp. T2V]
MLFVSAGAHTELDPNFVRWGTAVGQPSARELEDRRIEFTQFLGLSLLFIYGNRSILPSTLTMLGLSTVHPPAQ